MRTAVFLWLCWCAYFNCAGWILSAAHELNIWGCSLALIFWFAALLFWRRKSSATFFPQAHPPKFRRRFRRPLPAIYLLVAAMVFLGGVLYAPNNYDALTYRLPRMLHWLAAGHWFWISTANDRMNYSGAAWEWMAMPILAVLRSDRGLFLINAIGFLLMPGLIFSVFRQLGIARRVAWTWMWILPLAYGCATQAGGIGNDFAGVLFALISIHYGLQARRSQEVKDVWLAGLAAALMTGVKLSNLPLLLPCLVAVWPAMVHLHKRWFASAAVACVAVLISGAPIMALNQIYTGSWTGDPKNLLQMQIKSPPAAFLGNSLLLLKQSFMPPVLPAADKVNDWLDEKIPASWRRTLKEKFPRYYTSGLKELPQEEAAGLGLGVTLLLLASAGAAACEFMRKKSLPKISPVGLAAWISVLFYMCKMGSESTARLMLPYYPLAMIPVLLSPAQNRLLHFRAWKILAMLAALSVLPAVILSPARPLWPAVSVSEWLVRHYPGKPAAQRTAAVYLAYAHRNDVLAPLRDGLPKGVLKIGFFATENDTAYSLWRPFGLRQVEDMQIAADQSIKVPAGVEWIVVKRDAWSEATHVPLETWAARHHAKITLSVPIVTLVGWGEQTWCVLHIEKP